MTGLVKTVAQPGKGPGAGAGEAEAVWWIACSLAADLCDVGDPNYAVMLYMAGGYENRQRGAGRALARKVSCYLASVAGDLSSYALKRVAHLEHKTLRAHVAEIEDMREPGGAFDALIGALEAELRLKVTRIRLAKAWRSGGVLTADDLRALDGRTTGALAAAEQWTPDLFSGVGA